VTLIEHFDLTAARQLLGQVLAPWVQELGLSVVAIESSAPDGASSAWQPGAVLLMPFSQRLCREGGVVSGQALMSLADTAMVLAVATAGGRYRPMTTVDQTTHFLKPVAAADVLADARIVRHGRTMSFGRVTLLNAQDHTPAAIVTSAYALL
jgi:uncharacterized protein (TIGR00369 family)